MERDSYRLLSIESETAGKRRQGEKIYSVGGALSSTKSVAIFGCGGALVGMGDELIEARVSTKRLEIRVVLQPQLNPRTKAVIHRLA